MSSNSPVTVVKQKKSRHLSPEVCLVMFGETMPEHLKQRALSKKKQKDDCRMKKQIDNMAKELGEERSQRIVLEAELACKRELCKTLQARVYELENKLSGGGSE